MTTILAPLAATGAAAPGSTLSWPTAAEFRPARLVWGSLSSATAWSSPYTGQAQSISHLADRLRVSMDLPPCVADLAGSREAFFMAATSAGSWISLHNLVRPVPLGTLRGSPTVAADALAGARFLSVQTSPAATLLAGDVLGVGQQIIQCGYGGAVANGTGLMVVPLVLPLRQAAAIGAAVTWSAPQATFQLLSLQSAFAYSPGRIQEGLQVDLAEVFA